MSWYNKKENDGMTMFESTKTAFFRLVRQKKAYQSCHQASETDKPAEAPSLVTKQIHKLICPKDCM